MEHKELIDECRQEIDTIDKEIVTCLVRRINITKDIAGYKKLLGTPILDEDREHQVIEMARDFTEGLVSEEVAEKMKTIVEHVFRTILDDSRRYEYGCTYDENVIDADYEGAPKVEPLFTCNSDKYLGIIDKAIEANERETAWSNQYEINRIKTAMEQLTATLPQINDLFEMHRRLEKAGIDVTRDDILGSSAVQITINHDYSGKYYLCGGKTKLVAMDADGKFYVNCTKTEYDHFLCENCYTKFPCEVTLERLTEIIKTCGLDVTYIEHKISDDKTMKDVAYEFYALADGLRYYAEGLAEYISDLRTF
jgi:chorismate mutase